jgi:serine/threonine-protein kinase
MGEVYLAATTGIEGAERPCVVKIIRREHAKDSSFLARFLDEARVQAQLHHPGVVQVIEAANDENGEPFVVVEYVEGRSLGEVRARALQVSYRLSWSEAVALGTSTAEALAHIHERVDVSGSPLGIVHRDMSPQNIMVGYGGDVKLIDFGTARGENRRCHTVSGVVFAKPGYVAPEVANGISGDARVDLYALGIMVWELAAGRRFLQGDAAEHLAKVAKNECSLPPIAGLVGAPPELDTIIAKLTAFDAAERYPSARDALRDMARLLSSATSLTNGERGVRARVSQLMNTLYPSEPTQSRRLFAKLVAQAREMEKNGHSLVAAAPEVSGRETPEADERVLPGTRYRILRKIGEGAMGNVFEAEHIDLGRRVAIKVLTAEHATSSDYAARFRREARALSRLSHPNLVTLHDFGQATDGRLYCAMEFLQGQTLDDCLERDGALSWREALKLGAQAASALRDAHHVGIIHRDLKPSNLFLCEDGSLKMLDFGVARKRDEGGDQDASTFTLFGTPEYMAPEQVSSGIVDERADVYALGCVLYEMVTGRLPIVADTTVSLLDAKTKKDPDAPRVRAPSKGIPVEVDRLIMRALVRNPAKRTATADLLLAEIQAALDAPHRRRRQRRTLGRLALGASLMVAALSLSTALVRQYPDHVQLALSTLMAAPSSVEVTAPVESEVAVVEVESVEAPAAVQVASLPLVSTANTIPEESPAALAERAAQRRDWPAAIEAARGWVASSATKESRLFLARVLIHSQQHEEARSLLEELNAEDPGCAEARSLLRVSVPTEPGAVPSVEEAPKPRVARR